MKHESASVVMQLAAIRLMQRVEAITRSARPVVVLAPGDRPGSALAERHLIDELEAMRLADNPGGLCTRVPQENVFYPARGHWANKGRYVHRETIERLIRKGLMAWNNSCRTAAVLTEAGATQAPAETDVWERQILRRGSSSAT